jgi:hypothetical protein
MTSPAVVRPKHADSSTVIGIAGAGPGDALLDVGPDDVGNDAVGENAVMVK